MGYVMYRVINTGKETPVIAALVEVKLLLVDVIVADFAFIIGPNGRILPSRLGPRSRKAACTMLGVIGSRARRRRSAGLTRRTRYIP